MKVNSITYSPNFGARIKINKPSNYDAIIGSTLSTMGTTSSAVGASAIEPLADPAHHIHIAAKVVDTAAASSGLGSIGVGGFSCRYATEFFKTAVKNISNKKIPS